MSDYKNCIGLIFLCLLKVIATQDTIVDGFTEIEAIEGRESFLPCMRKADSDSTMDWMIESSTIRSVDVKKSSLAKSKVNKVVESVSPMKVEDPTLIIWYRGNSGIPIFTVDARNSSNLSTASQLSSPEYEGRVEFDTRLVPPALRIRTIYKEDEAQYRCRCDFLKSRSQNFILNLTVIVPPEKIRIMNGNSLETVQGVIGPFDEGSSLHLICESVGGKPLPSVIWFKDGNEIIDTEYAIMDAEIVRNELKIKKMIRKDLMSKYTCRATNSMLLNPPLEDSISIDLNLKPLEVTIVSPKRVLSAGVRTELSCRSSGSRPPAQITWWMGSYQIKAAEVRQTLSTDGNTSHSSFSFIPTPNDNQQVISCRAQNVLLRNTPLEEKFLLEVHYVPQVRIALGAKIDEESIREGMDVYFECIVNSHPWISEVTWMFEGTVLFSDPSSGIIISNQSLVLQRVKRESRGRYWCHAINSEGRGESNEFYLKVLFAPVCSPAQKTTYGVARNELLQVVCDVESDPSNVTFSWFFNDSHDSSLVQSFTSNNTRSIASFVPSGGRNYGKMICLAENQIGRQKDACVFNIIPANPPEAVSNCSVKNQSMLSLLVTCTPGESGGLRQTFFLELHDAEDHSLQSNITAYETAIFLLTNLKAGTKYTMHVYAANSKGRSLPVILTAPLSTQSEKQSHYSTTEQEQEFALTPVMAIIICAGIVTSLTFFSVLVCLIRSKSRPGSCDETEGISKPSPSQSSTSNVGPGYVTADGMLLKTLKESSDHENDHLVTYSVVGCKSSDVVTGSEVDHELAFSSEYGSSRVYCKDPASLYNSAIIDYSQEPFMSHDEHPQQSFHYHHYHEQSTQRSGSAFESPATILCQMPFKNYSSPRIVVQGGGGSDALSIMSPHVTPDVISLGQQGHQQHNASHLVSSGVHVSPVPGQQHFHLQTSCGNPYSASPV